MEVMYERVAGLDVHKATIVACVRIHSGRQVKRECRTFSTTTDDLQALLSWLSEQRCTHVAMEATGVYWIPVWMILNDGDFDLIVANAAHVKNVPGRKTDLNDAMWLADLMACGLINGSFVPEEPLQELRSLMRSRKQLGREQTRHVQRMHKALIEANIRLDQVISDIMGASGRRIIEAMISGVRDPNQLAALASKRIKATAQELHDALHGRLTDHHRFLLKLHLGQYDALEAAIRDIDGAVDAQITRIDQQLKAAAGPGAKATPFHELIKLLAVHDPGRQRPRRDHDPCRNRPRHEPLPHRRAPCFLGRDVSRSAGKRKSTRLRKGDPWLKVTLVQCAWAAKRKKDSYYRAQFFRIQSRRGPQKAICAVAASILTAVYHILKDGTEHRDLGADYFNRRSAEAQTKRLVAQLGKLGYEVQLQPTAQAA